MSEMVVNRDDLFFEFIMLLKKFSSPLNQNQIVEKFFGEKKRPYGTGVVIAAFSPSFLQPFWSNKDKQFVEPILIKVKSPYNVNSLYVLNPKWRQATDDEIRTVLRTDGESEF